jgi:hypothetical protein
LARSKTPNPLQRRHLLEEKLTPARAKTIAEAYLAENRPFDALAFLAKAGEQDRLRALAGEAATQGDLFLVREIAALVGEEPDAEEWREVARAAAAAGKERYASEAERLAAARSGERPRAR